jgi:two-component system phosphate regulon sensor histidine kinase PhoR
VRRSGSFGTSYLYTAKKVTAGGGAVVLRAATELRAVNAYIWGVLGLTAGIFAVVLLVTGALSRTLSVRLTRPFGLIKDRLDAVLSPDAAAALPAPPPAEPTDYPEVNAALSDIAVLSDRVRDTLVSARKLAKEKQEFFANASHELNTPLSSILGWCETMLLGGKYERAFLETIDKEATRMKNLIADMLSISSLEGGGATEDAPLNIKDVAAGVTTSFQPRAREKDITIYADLSDGIIHADREKIIQLISNLVDNAVKYGNHGGNVWIKTECAGGAVTLTVRDDGIGIPKKYQNRVFERFFRVDKGRARSEGTGLGLSIVKHIASRYDATLTLTGSETTGTEIKVTFKQLTGGGGVVV